MRQSSKTIVDANIDQYGNVKEESSSDTVTLSTGTEVRNATLKRSFDAANTTTWWINKLLRQETTASAVAGTHISGQSALAGLNPSRTSTSLYGYDPSNRQVSCEAMLPGTIAVVTNSSCTTAALGTGAAAVAGTVERKSTSSFDSFGNVSGVTSSARGGGVARTVSSTYDASGYFPTTVIDAFGAKTTSVFDESFGKPTSVTDANGLVTGTSFDGLGRELSMTAPSAFIVGNGNNVNNQLAPTKRVFYENCNGSLCGASSLFKMRVVSDQLGSPRQIVWMDALGRTLRTATAAFNQTTNTGSVLSWDVVDQSYSNRGLLAATVEPIRVTNAALNSTGLLSSSFATGMRYDRLGRVVVKSSARTSRDTGSYGTALNYRTEYVHSNFKTDIKVCAQAANAACPAGALTSLGYVLNMSREFDGAGAVVRTVDANNGVTRFYYDGARNPALVIDAENAQTKAVYNDVGHRTQVTDPNRGIWNFEYSGFGELAKQTDARGWFLTQVFDRLGRMTSRSWSPPCATTSAAPLCRHMESCRNSTGTGCTMTPRSSDSPS